MSPLLGQMNELDGVAHWTHHSISKSSFLAAIIPLNAFPTLGRGRVQRDKVPIVKPIFEQCQQYWLRIRSEAIAALSKMAGALQVMIYESCSAAD